MPTTYTQRLTATDIAQLQSERQSLRNHILERTFYCWICSQEFPKWENKQIDEHQNEHKAALAMDGTCVWCGNTNFGSMTVEQKRRHVKSHIQQAQARAIEELLREQSCPACNQDFRSWSLEDMFLHCINTHQPGTLQFCSKCGVQGSLLNLAESNHHKINCHDKPDLLVGTTTTSPNFCQNCGQDLNVVARNVQILALHEKDCKPHFGNWYHNLCGINMTTQPTPDEFQRQEQICKKHPLNGWKGKYCRKCGKQLYAMDDGTLKRHNEECWKRVEQPWTSDEERAKSMKLLTSNLIPTCFLNTIAVANISCVEIRRHEQQLELDRAQNQSLLAAAQAKEKQNKTWDERLQLREAELRSKDKGYTGIDSRGFNCPLETADGVCDVPIDHDDSQEIKNHYMHRHWGTAPKDQGRGVNSRLKNLIDRLRKDNKKNVTFLEESDRKVYSSMIGTKLSGGGASQLVEEETETEADIPPGKPSKETTQEDVDEKKEKMRRMRADLKRLQATASPSVEKLKEIQDLERNIKGLNKGVENLRGHLRTAAVPTDPICSPTNTHPTTVATTPRSATASRQTKSPSTGRTISSGGSTTTSPTVGLFKPADADSSIDRRRNNPPRSSLASSRKRSADEETDKRETRAQVAKKQKKEIEVNVAAPRRATRSRTALVLVETPPARRRPKKVTFKELDAEDEEVVRPSNSGGRR
jgi:hypothetical protein